MNVSQTENDGTANANIGTIVVVLIVIVVSFTISYIGYQHNASADAIGIQPPRIVPVLTPSAIRIHTNGGPGGPQTPPAKSPGG